MVAGKGGECLHETLVLVEVGAAETGQEGPEIAFAGGQNR
jgi:hypothetical protein